MSVRSCRRVGFVSLVRKRGACLVEGIDGKRVSLVSGDSQQQYGDGVGADGSLVRERRDVSATMSVAGGGSFACGQFACQGARRLSC